MYADKLIGADNGLYIIKSDSRADKSAVGAMNRPLRAIIHGTLQFSTHPIGLLRSMFVRDVVADVIAVFKHPEFCPAACLGGYALPLFRRHKPVAAALDDQERTCYPLCHPLQVELL